MYCFGNSSQGSCLLLASPEADPEVRIHVQVFIQQVLPRELGREWGPQDREREEATHRGNLREKFLEGNLSFIPQYRWNMSSTLVFSPTHCKGTRLLYISGPISYHLSRGSGFLVVDVTSTLLALCGCSQSMCSSSRAVIGKRVTYVRAVGG